MGKKGDALRLAKRQRVVYSFTKEELEARDKQLLLEHEERLREKTSAAVEAQWKLKEENAKRIIRDEWDERMRLFNSGDAANNMVEFTRLAMMIPIKLLVTEFGWKPVKKNRAGIPDGRYSLTRLHDLCALELNDIASDEEKDLRNYYKEAVEITGVHFDLSEDSEW